MEEVCAGDTTKHEEAMKLAASAVRAWSRGRTVLPLS